MARNSGAPVVVGVVLIAMLFIGGMLMVSSFGSVDTSGAVGTDLENVSTLVTETAGLTMSIHPLLLLGLTIGCIIAAVFVGVVIRRR